MPRYQLISEEVPTGPIESIGLKELRDLGVKKQMNFLLENGIAVKGSVKVEKFNLKFSVEWKDAKTGLYKKQSYVPFIAKNGDIRNKSSGSLTVLPEAPQSE